MADKTAFKKAKRQLRKSRKTYGKAAVDQSPRTAMLPWVLVGTMAVALYTVINLTDWRGKVPKLDTTDPTDPADVSTTP